MAYRYEKKEDGVIDLVLSGWENGIANSAFVGIENMQNVDIFTYPTMIQAGYRSVSKKTTTDLVRWFARDPQGGQIFGVDFSGGLYNSSDLGQTWANVGGTPSNSGAGLSVWKNYLLLPGPTVMNTYGPLSGSPAWGTLTPSGSSPAMTSSIWHPTYVGPEDDFVWVGNTRDVGQLIEVIGSTFDPGNSATYLWNTKALKSGLPQYYTIKTIAGLGLNLYLGTFQGTNITDRASADLFVWDRTNPRYNNVIKLDVNGINMLKAQNNLVYIYAGIGADICYTNSTVTSIYKRNYNVLFPNPAQHASPQPGAIAFLNNLDLLIGMSYLGGNAVGPLGVYAIRTTPSGAVSVLRNLASTGNSTLIRIGAIMVIDRERFIFSWSDETGGPPVYGIDAVGFDGRYMDYSSQVDMDVIPVGTKTLPKTFVECEVRLAKPLGASDGVKVWFRKSDSGSFTLIKDFDGSSDLLGQVSAQAEAGINDATIVQVRVQLKGDALLKEIRLR